MYIDKILQTEVQRFIDENIHSDLIQILFSGSPFKNVSIQEIVQQIKGKRIAEKKFPSFLKDNIIFPPNINLEQTSSESTANFKSNLFSGESFLDLTSGFGIDSFFISKNFKHITLVEKNKSLLEIVKHNFKIFNKYNIKYFNIDADTFLKNNKEKFSLIYVDPSRRDFNNNKKFLLKDLSPNILEIQEKLLEHTSNVAIKLSPLIDLYMLVSQINNISEIHVIAVKNDVKEVLCIIDSTIQISNDKIKLKLHNLESNEPSIELHFKDIKNYKPFIGEPLEFLYIPNNAVMKSNAFGYISKNYNLQKLHPNTHLFTSSESIENFPGRKLKIRQISPKEIKKGTRYNIISKNYPLKAEEIKKKYMIKDGGEKYIIFTQSQRGLVVLEST